MPCSMLRRAVARIAGMVGGGISGVAGLVAAAMAMPSTAGRVCLILLLMPGGCGSIGPATVPRDRLNYVTAIGDSWKEQTLLNIVRMRYGDAPNFIEISSIISSYAFQGQLSAGVQIGANAAMPAPSGSSVALPVGQGGHATGSLNAGATYLDRPTFTCTPLTGNRFAKSLLQPIPASAIIQLIQTGYPADNVLQMTVQTIDDIDNRSSIGGYARPAERVLPTSGCAAAPATRGCDEHAASREQW